MTTNRDFKRVVRARMRKTGEAYTTARAQLLLKKQPSPPAAGSRSSARDYAKLAGRSDATIKANTGCTWELWVKTLDYQKAHTWPHREIAKFVHEKYKVPGWWSQTVAVGYERIKGLRAVGQRLDGTYEASKSKVIAVPLARVYRAVSNARTRARWLPEARAVVKTATRDKYVRLAWPDATSVVIGFARKGAAKSQVAIQHSRLADKATATRMKAYWAERLAALERVLA